jgi:hypothetical protein
MLRLNGNLGGTLNDSGVGPGRDPPFDNVSALKFTRLQVESGKPTTLHYRVGPNLNCISIVATDDVIVSTVASMDIGLGSAVPIS